jgi:hypothetical protein
MQQYALRVQQVSTVMTQESHAVVATLVSGPCMQLLLAETAPQALLQRPVPLLFVPLACQAQ